MPTVLRIGPFQFKFFAADEGEPRHVHVRRDKQRAKFWLEPTVALATNNGFSDRELNVIEKLVTSNRQFFVERWNEFFGR
jgi:hypothetical protein